MVTNPRENAWKQFGPTKDYGGGGPGRPPSGPFRRTLKARESCKPEGLGCLKKLKK